MSVLNKKIAVIVGAGPAGLTAAYELLVNTDVKPMAFEKDGLVGGISRTVNYKGNRIDIGGHRFFSKSNVINEFWEKFLPVNNGEAESSDDVMLIRSRLSRIFYRNRFFDYPVTLSLSTLKNLGIMNSLNIGIGFLCSQICKRTENNLENFYINRFGKPLYSMFFESYTEKVWGLHPSELGADWGAQRVKGLSVAGVVKDMFQKAIGIKGRNIETSLIEEFKYPKYGPGQLWEKVAAYVTANGGEVIMNSDVTKIHVNDQFKVDYVTVTDGHGKVTKVACDYCLSSMPIKELIERIIGIDVPEDVRKIAGALKYRDFVTVGILVKDQKIKDRSTGKKIKDNWIYIQDSSITMGRIQILNNWSPYMVKNPIDTVWLCLEYFCNEGDRLWEMPDAEFIGFAVDELVRLGFVERENVLDAVRIKMPKAYPAYYGSYHQLDTVTAFLDSISNLYCIGRNGQHRYNNMDHSMLTAIEAVKAIKSGTDDKSRIWKVNTEKVYHEK